MLNLADRSPAPEPYSNVSGGRLIDAPNRASPDPLSNFRWDNPTAGNSFQIYVLRPKSVRADRGHSFCNLSSLLNSASNVEVNGPGTIRFDFGVESAAWMEFDSPDCPSDIEMSLSEYNEPGVDKTQIAVRHGNTYRLELNPELYDGMRFGWIRVKSWKSSWHITGVRAVCQVKPTNYRGSFSSSDTVLTKAWYMAAYGVKASLCKDYFGSILMDRGDRMSWTGDAHPAQAAALVAFANYDFIRQNLENTSKQDNGIRSYSLYWILSLLDYYRYTGDTSTLKKYLPNVLAKLKSAESVFGKHPPLGFYGWDERLGAGFEIWFRPCAEPDRAYQMLCIRAWQEFADVMVSVGRDDLHDQFAHLAKNSLVKLTSDIHWNEPYGIHSASDAINTGLLSRTDQEALFHQEFSDRGNRLSLSPFNEYFILQALARLGKWDEALTTARDMWGGMLQYGGTTPFEVYRPQWNSEIGVNGAVPNTQCGIVSLCHPWGAGILKWLSEQILGIVPTAPGFSRYSVQPHFGSRLTQVSGVTPTPHGDIEAHFDRLAGTAYLNSPIGTVGRFCFPKAGRSIKQLTVNGNLVWDGQFHASKGLQGATQDAEFVIILGVQPGSYNLRIQYAGNSHFAPEAPIVYPAKVVGWDTRTQGNWLGSYGRDGSILCGYEPDGKDLLSLPSYVDSVDFFRAFPHNGRPDRTLWSPETSDRRALQSSHSAKLTRVASSISNTDQTMSLTIKFKNPHSVRIGLYFVDWESKGHRLAVETFDANSLRMIAPVKVVRDFEGGKYLIFEVDRSVKFRFDKIRGDLVTLSGVFFDPVN